jgi:hypothetical protein
MKNENKYSVNVCSRFFEVINKTFAKMMIATISMSMNRENTGTPPPPSKQATFFIIVRRVIFIRNLA